MSNPIKSLEIEQLTEVKTAVLKSSKHWIRNFFPNLRDAGIRWSEDDASSLAASVAYYLALSMFPLMLLLTSGFGIFLQFSKTGKKAEEQILVMVETHASPIIKKQIEQVLTQLQNQSLVSGPFGFMAATLAAIGIFAQIDRGFDRIFRIPAQKDSDVRRTIYRVMKSRFLAFMMLASLGGAILVMFAAGLVMAQFQSITSSAVPSMRYLLPLAELASNVVGNGLLFSLVYRWLPKKYVCWKDAFRGGLLAACIWELGRFVLGAFLIGMRYSSAYGAVGSFIAILLWCYYGISILFFGAEYVQVLQLRRQGSPTTGHATEGAKNEVPMVAIVPTEQVPSESNAGNEVGELEETTRRRLPLPSELDRQTPRRAMEKSNP
ncbi:MAG: YihY/virulence factor BrkB family protein [Planctomycetota bacterium]|nr:YihY/virulence factor BrkB family protein [Planctomycetota bacterium]